MKKNITITYTFEKLDKKRYIKRIEEKGLTQVEVANQLGISFTMFYYILNGKRHITSEQLINLEKIL